MRTCTTDPVSANDVIDTDNAPFVMEGAGANALKICFESEDNKLEYLDIPVHTCKAVLSVAYDRVADPAITGTFNQ